MARTRSGLRLPFGMKEDVNAKTDSAGEKKPAPYSMRVRMLFFYAVMTVIIMAVSFIVQGQMGSSILELNEGYYASLLVQTAKTIDSHLANYQKLASVFSENPLMRFYIKQITANHSMYEVASQGVKRQILRYPNKDMFDGIYVYVPGMSPINCFFNNVITDTDSQMKALMAEFDDGTHGASSRCVVTRTSPYQLSMVNPIYDKDRFLGMMRLDLNMDFFTKIIGEVEQDKDSVLMILEDNTILYSSRYEEILTTVGDPAMLEKAVSYPITSVGWNFVGTLPRIKIQQVTTRFGTTFLTMMLAIMAVVALYSLLSFRSMMNPVRRIIERMSRVEGGNFDVKLPENNIREYNAIVEKFNSMIEKIKNLVETVYYQQVYLRKAQIGEMQSKFNPHFLYNTLDMIYWHLVKKNDDDTAEMVVALSEILRYSITSNHEFNSICEERRQIENYLMLQSNRLGENFEWEINFDEDILNYKIPCLLLQPLVENAINHAFQDDRTYRYIGITGSKEDHALILTVVDNGIGMSKEALDRILNEDLPRDADESRLGISLVHKRLQYIYGNEYGIQIRSEPQMGCTIRVMLEAHEDASKYMAPPGAASGTQVQ